MDQRITHSKSDIIDIYRENIQPENLTLWHPHRDWQRSGQQEVVSEPGEAVIRETKAVESPDKNMVIDRVKILGQDDEDGCTVLSFIDCGYDIV